MANDSPGRERAGDPGHQVRVAENESTFRQVNEAIESGAASGEDPVGFLCECGRLGCSTIVEVPRAEYEAVRSDFDRFLVVPGHQDPSAEDVAEDHGNYLVVVKHGPAASVTQATDPRGGQPG